MCTGISHLLVYFQTEVLGSLSNGNFLPLSGHFRAKNGLILSLAESPLHREVSASFTDL